VVTADASAIDALRGQVHVWLARPDEINDPELLSEYRAILSPEERERHLRFRGDALRRLFLVSHALVRTSLSRYFDVAPGRWAFRAGEHGRPEIDPPTEAPRLRFNLSHTHGLVTCAVCIEADVGVDVERVDRVRDLDGVAKRVFTESERAILDALEGRAKQGRFTDFWALKEAYIKAKGMGFQLNPSTFSVELGEAESEDCRLRLGTDFEDRAEDWQLALFPIDPGRATEFRLAVALHRAGRPRHEIVVREVVPAA